MREIFALLAAVAVTAAMFATEEALSGKFSINTAGDQIQFSQGNLQYQASTNTWRFAEFQWDLVGMGYNQIDVSYGCYIGGTVVGSDNRQISATYTGWIDLFGWGTGGNPTETNYDYNYSSFTDWGKNPISNGGNTANQWRTLTDDEWVYILETRENASSKYGVGTVGGNNGIILLPDDWTLPADLSFTSGVHSNYNWGYFRLVNEYSLDQWMRMEANGAVFLPAAGHRLGTVVGDVGSRGRYWSAKPFDTSGAYYLEIESNRVFTYNSYYYYGFSVRLVRQAESTSTDIEDVIAESGKSNITCQKILLDGTLYILRPDGAIFKAQGARVR